MAPGGTSCPTKGCDCLISKGRYDETFAGEDAGGNTYKYFSQRKGYLMLHHLAGANLVNYNCHSQDDDNNRMATIGWQQEYDKNRMATRLWQQVDGNNRMATSGWQKDDGNKWMAKR